MSEWQKRPWTARQFQPDSYTYNWCVEDCEGKDVVLACTKDTAFVLSAATELLEACEQCLRHIEQDESTHGRPFAAGNVARAAIKKARGES